MTVSEIIKELQKYEKEFGDTEVIVDDWDKKFLVREVTLSRYPNNSKQIEFRIWKRYDELDNLAK